MPDDHELDLRVTEVSKIDSALDKSDSKSTRFQVDFGVT